jgi:hypothetical protein
MTLPKDVIETLRKAGMQTSAIDTDASEAFERAEFIPATLDAWLAKQREARPHWFIGGVQTDLETLAFASGNITARARLVKELGEDAATERAKEWGLKSITDFKTHGQRPGGEQQKEKPKGDNPWAEGSFNVTRQGQIAKADLALAQRLAKAAGSYIGATKPGRTS